MFCDLALMEAPERDDAHGRCGLLKNLTNYFSTMERLSLEACHMLASVLFWLLGSSNDFKVPKVPGLMKSHSVRKGRHRQEKTAEMSHVGGETCC